MLSKSTLASLSALAASVYGQQIGTNTAETHPSLSWQTCSAGGSCTTTQASVTLDSNWRWLHTTTGYTNCYTGNAWDASLCSSPTTCASNCALDGADYSGTYGITTSGNALTLKFKTGSNVGSRVYLLESDNKYKLFNLKNKEFTFDVDVSQLGCGLNGALYFSAMDADGGQAKFSSNKAGAKYGTGYCDSQCPHDIKFINGEANILDWTGTSTNAGSGRYGACCTEMDIWEANKISTAYTPHGCKGSGLTRCDGADCGDEDRYGGVCDKDGCDFNSYRMGVKDFYGPGSGFKLDTTKKMTVVTQFVTNGNTDTGALKEIRRVYVQNGVVIANSHVNIPGIDPSYDSITADFCAAQKTTFGDTNDFANKGGLQPMDAAFTKGMVLVMSVWDDYAANMLWLDSTYPVDGTGPGKERGTCATTSGVPADVESQQASAQVIFSNIKVGPIGSTYPSGGSSSSVRPPTTSARPPTTSARPPTTSVRPPTTSARPPVTSQPPNCAAKWGQCGGQGWTGPTCCQSGSTCKVSNQWYSQCL